MSICASFVISRDYHTGLVITQISTRDLSALDKLLGQLGSYATWLSSIAYLQKKLRIFIYFLLHVFGSDYIRFLLDKAIANVPIYLLSLSAFLSIKLADFY